MKTPHKHAEMIKAWADGAKIQFRFNEHIPWQDARCLGWWDKDCEYRIKPEPKPNEVLYACYDAFGKSSWLTLRTYNVEQSINREQTGQLKLTIDGETGKFKSVEVL